MAILIALILTVSTGASMTLIPNASAHTPPWVTTTPFYVDVGTNPIGVGQQVLVIMQVGGVPLPTSTLLGGDRFNNFKVNVTAPDGTITTYGPYTADPTGGTYFTFVPSQVGTYSLVGSWPGMTLTNTHPDTGIVGSNPAYIGDIYYGATSKVVTLTVQQEPLPSSPSYPFPTEYWTRPINGQNTNWNAIASNWLSGPYEPDSFVQNDGGSGPESAHVLWTFPLDVGGIVGSLHTKVNGTMFYDGMSYNARMANPIIMDGQLYTAIPYQDLGQQGGVEDIDLATGKVVWANPNMTTPAFGYYYDLEFPDQFGVIPQGILFTSNFAQAWSPTTGQQLFTVTGVPSGTMVIGPQGEVLKYYFHNYGNSTNPNWYLAQWNSTDLYQNLAASFTPSIAKGAVVNANIPINSTTLANIAAGNIGIIPTYDWNISLPPELQTALSYTSVQAAANGATTAIYNDLILGTSTLSGFGGYGTPNPWTAWALSLNPATRGQLLFIQNYTAPPGNDTLRMQSFDPLNHVFIMQERETFEYYGYSATNGTLLWQADMPGANHYEYYDSSFIKSGTASAYGIFYQTGFSGEVWAFNATNGNLMWTYGTGGEGNSTQSTWIAYGHRPTFLGNIADGKVYMYDGEHSPNSPIWKGGQVYCLDAYTGQLLWSMDGWVGYPGRTATAVADGNFVWFNSYDSQIYDNAKGPSQLTVSAPNTAASITTPIVIRGTVIDISPGTRQTEQAARFPSGVPAVSDESQGEWMNYVYEQIPKPTNATGVPVTINVIDSNGNNRPIGTTTSDTSGMFTLTWTPDIPGNYTVIANFAGSKSYWPSSAETSFYATEAPATPAPTSAPISNVATTSDLLMYMAASVIAIIIAIAIVGLLILRKHP